MWTRAFLCGVFMSGFSVNVRSNADKAIFDLLSAASEVPEATVRALNKMADQVKVSASREIRAAGYGLKAADIKKALKVRRASKDNLTATVVASGRPLPLMQYGARQTSKGVSVNVSKGRKVIAEAFIATMPSGHKGVFVREPGARHKKVGQGKQASWHALPIRELFGPSVPGVLSNDAIQGAIQSLIMEKFPKLLDHEQKWASRRVSR
jgi:hypothetical protein